MRRARSRVPPARAGSPRWRPCCDAIRPWPASRRVRRAQLARLQGGTGDPRDPARRIIRATLEPERAALFDGCFRPAAAARARWQRLWLAAHRGAALPPISVVRMGDGYAVSDGHHRVSVARARARLTIDAVVEAGCRPRPRSPARPRLRRGRCGPLPPCSRRPSGPSRRRRTAARASRAAGRPPSGRPAPTGRRSPGSAGRCPRRARAARRARRAGSP